jgi:hypothetical protein
VDSFPDSVVKAEKQAIGAPPPLSAVSVSVDVADEKEASLSDPKGNYSSSMTVGESINSFPRMPGYTFLLYPEDFVLALYVS